MLLDKVMLVVPVMTKVHSKPKHAMHEGCVVSHAGPIHGLGVNIIQVGAHYDVPERPVHCERHVWMTVQGVQVVPVQVGHG